MPLQFWRSRQDGGQDNGSARANPAAEPAASFETQLEGMKERFRTRLRDDYAVLVQYRERPSPPTPELASIVHRLAGSAGMLGYTTISAIAGRLDDAFAETDADVSAPFQELLTVLEETASVKTT